MGGAGQGLRLVFGELMQEEMRQGPPAPLASAG